MNLDSLFPQTKTLASHLPHKRTSSPIKAGSPAPFKRRPVPYECPFPIEWPEVPEQGIKDYQVITSEEDLRAYLQKCIDLGRCFFDYETAPDERTRDEWKHYTDDLRYRVEAAEGDERALKIINAEYEKKYEEYLKTPLDPHRSDVCTFSVSGNPDEARIVFLSHKKGSRNFEPYKDRDEARMIALDILNEMIFRNEEVLTGAYNLTFETKMSAKYGYYILGRVTDPFVMIVRTRQIAAPKSLADPIKPAYGNDLKTQSEKVFGVKMSHFKDVLAKKNVEFFDEISTDDPDAVVYSAEDSDLGLQHHLYWDQIAKQIPCDNELYHNYSEWLHGVEMPFSRVIGLMEYHGMAWNTEEAIIKRQEAETKQEETREKIKQLVKDTLGIDVDPRKTGKTKEVRDALFEKMGIPAVAWSDKTDDESLDNPAILNMLFLLEHNLEDLKEEELLSIPLPDNWEWMNVDNNTVRDGHPLSPEQVAEVVTYLKRMRVPERNRIRIAQRKPHPYKEQGMQLLNYMRQIQKQSTLLSSHIKGREKYINPVTGCIHAGYTPWTDTGRLNSSKPNQQNVPKPDNDEFGIRGLYKAPKGKVLYRCDESGFELRLMSWKSGDQVMQNAFNSSDPVESDLHTKTAMTLTGKSHDQVTKQERNMSKSGNFGICYGGTEHALQKTLLKLGFRKSLDECFAIVQAVKRTYPAIPVFQESIGKQAQEDGYVEAIYGYKRLLPDINSSDRSLMNRDKRRAANTPIQGSAAEIMKRNQNRLYDWIGKEHLHGIVDMVAQIHDEVIMYINDDVKTVLMADAKIKEIMGTPPLPNFPVPIVGESAIGYTWKEKISIEEWQKRKAV